MEATTEQRRSAQSNTSTVENGGATGSTTLLEKPSAGSERTPQDALTDMKRKNDAPASAITDVKKNVDRAIAASQQVRKGAGEEVTGTERANFESLRAVSEINRARAEALMTFNEKHHIFTKEDLAKAQNGDVPLDELKKKVEQSNANESEKKELMATLQELDSEYKRLCESFESRAKELGLRIVYLPTEKFGDIISQIQSSDFKNMSYEELVKKYPWLMGSFKKRMKEIIEEEKELRKKEGKLTFDDAKIDPSLREAYVKQKMKEVLSKKKYAHLRSYVDMDRVGYYDYSHPEMHPELNNTSVSQNAAAFTVPGEGGLPGSIFVTDGCFYDPSVTTEKKLEGVLVHELRHLQDLAETGRSTEGPAEEAETEHLLNGE